MFALGEWSTVLHRWGTLGWPCLRRQAWYIHGVVRAAAQHTLGPESPGRPSHLTPHLRSASCAFLWLGGRGEKTFTTPAPCGTFCNKKELVMKPATQFYMEAPLRGLMGFGAYTWFPTKTRRKTSYSRANNNVLNQSVGSFGIFLKPP